MTGFPIGDMSLFFQNANQTSAIKSRMQTLAQELSSGKVADLSQHLGGDTNRLAGIDREIGLLDSFATAGTDLSRIFTQQQIVLESANELRVNLSSQFLTVTTGSTEQAIGESGVAAREAFGRVVGSMNATIGGRSLFAGTADNGNALAAADDMLADIVASVGAATTSAGITAALDTWFNDPAGGFATMGYTGDTNALPNRKVSPTETVSISARADDPAIKEMLKALATAALVDVLGVTLTTETRGELIESAGVGLSSNSVALIGMTAAVGASQARVDDIAVTQASQRSAFAMARNDLTSADPYETAIKLQDVQTQLELQFAMTSRLSNLSLVNYL